MTKKIFTLKQDGVLIARVNIIKRDGLIDIVDFMRPSDSMSNTISWRAVEYFIKKHYTNKGPVYIGRVYFIAPEMFRVTVVKSKRKPMLGMEIKEGDGI